MKVGLMAALVVGAATLGAGGAFVAQQVYWDHELKVQLAEKDKLIQGLQDDLTGLRTGLGKLQKTNAAMQGLIDASLVDTGEVAKSNQGSLEKLRAIIVRLQRLQNDLKSTGQP